MTAGFAPNSGPSDAEWAEWRALVGCAGADVEASPVYRMGLNGPAPASVIATPKDPRPVNSDRGRAILEGDWRFDGPGARVRTPPDRAPWGPPFPTPHFADQIHRFHWLRDVASFGSDGQNRARSLVYSWIEMFGKWDAFAWRTGPTADRVINWLSAGPWLFGATQNETRELLLGALGRHVRHLQEQISQERDPASRFRAAVALCLAGSALPDADQTLSLGSKVLEEEVARQILADGGHASRSAEALAEAMIDLNQVEDLLLRVGVRSPAFLTRIQTRMASMLGFLTLDDGNLLVGHGGGERSGLAAAAMAPHGDVRSRFSFARLTGYQRVEAHDLKLFFDSGPAPETAFGGAAHASALALTVADGPDRILTGCGSHAALDPQLRDAARRTPAHANLTLDNTDSSAFALDADTDLLAIEAAQGVSTRRIEENDQYLIEGQHAGWRNAHGLIQRRRIYVAKNGARVTGEDTLSHPLSEPASPSRSIPYALRFPLHPDVEVRVEPGEDRTVYLGLPERQRIWRFRSEAPVQVEDSPYWGAGGARRTQQLVIRASADANSDGSSPPNRVRWAMSRVEPGV
ncbi:heparinase [bacterium]|nr:heparinase [bacterium]